MIKLTKEQKEFLDKHNLGINMVFDASWLKREEYQKIMEELGKNIAIGVAACRKEGHKMKTRAWHCLQCKTECIRYIEKRYDKSFIYIMWSENASLIKIWTAKDINNRASKLNNNNYAWLNDWQLLYYFKCPKAGKIEKEIHNNLSDYWYKKEYNNWRKNMISYEIFSCSYSKAKQIIENIQVKIWKYNITNEIEIKTEAISYNFPNIKNWDKRCN